MHTCHRPGRTSRLSSPKASMKDTTACGVEGSYDDPSTTSSARRMPVRVWGVGVASGNAAAAAAAVEVSTSDLLRTSLCPPAAPAGQAARYVSHQKYLLTIYSSNNSNMHVPVYLSLTGRFTHVMYHRRRGWCREGLDETGMRYSAAHGRVVHNFYRWVMRHVQPNIAASLYHV